jgi:lipopolysaccharide export LptBFGC system permease protein LptF
MSIFEIIMLLCFGIAWPFSIYKSYTSREVGSKSLIFLLALLLGYISGITHKIVYNPDPVVWFYALNGTMVAVDIALYLRNRAIAIQKSLEGSKASDS